MGDNSRSHRFFSIKVGTLASVRPEQRALTIHTPLRYDQMSTMKNSPLRSWPPPSACCVLIELTAASSHVPAFVSQTPHLHASDCELLDVVPRNQGQPIGALQRVTGTRRYRECVLRTQYALKLFHVLGLVRSSKYGLALREILGQLLRILAPRYGRG